MPSAGRIFSGTSGNTALMEARKRKRGVEKKREFEVQAGKGEEGEEEEEKEKRVEGACFSYTVSHQMRLIQQKV